jgi:tetratricopeptide (TPR) repeat protein
MYAIARRVFTDRVALYAGSAAAVYPVFYFFEAQLQKPSLAVFLILAMVYLLLRYTEEHQRRLLLGAGVAAGFSAVAQGHAYFFIPLAALWLAHAGPGKSVLVRLRDVALFLGVTAVCILPVTFRNYIVGREFVLTTYQAGTNFYIGNNEKATGIYIPLREGRELPPYEELDAVELAEQGAGRKLKASEVSSYWFGESWKFIRQQPGKYAALLGKKTLLFISAAEVPDVVDYDFIKEHSFLLRIPFFHFGLLIPLAVVGMIVTARSRKQGTILLYYCMAASFVSVVLFYVFSRYRLQSVPFVILFAAAGAAWLIDAARARRIRPVLAAALVMLPVGYAAHIDLQLVGRGLGYGLMGSMALESKDYPAAIKDFEEVIRRNPQNPGLQSTMHQNLAQCYLGMQNYASALAETDRVLALEKLRIGPADAEKQYDVQALRGLIFFKQGAYDTARDILEPLVAAYPDRAAARVTLGTVYKKLRLYDLAERELSAAIERDPRNIVALNNLANIYRAAGQVDRARDYYDRCLAIDPQNQAVLQNRARLDRSDAGAAQE